MFDKFTFLTVTVSCILACGGGPAPVQKDNVRRDPVATLPEPTPVEDSAPTPGMSSELTPVEDLAPVKPDLPAAPASDPRPEHDEPCPPGMALVEGGPVSKKQRQRWTKLYPKADPPPAEIAPFCLDLLEATEADIAACPEVIQAQPDMLPCLTRGDCGTKPVEGLSWREPAQYCAFRGKRMPTLFEWLWAAGGGTQDRKYPWGSTPPTVKHLNGCDEICARGAMSDCDEADKKSGFCTLRNFSNVHGGEDGYEHAAPVGSFLAGAGRWGHLDLVGNVAEHVKLRAGDDDDNRFVCGGSYEFTLPGFNFSLHKEICETTSSAPRSVRCASEPGPTDQL